MKYALKLIMIFVSCIIGSYLLSIDQSQAAGATMYLDPSSDSFSSGEEFTTDIMINTGGAEIQTARASISFDPDYVQIVSVSHSNIFCQFPESGYEVNNTSGIMILTGFCQDDYYSSSGDADILGRITFKAISGGTANISFRFDGSDDEDMTCMLEPGSPPQTLDIDDPVGAVYKITGGSSSGGDDLPDTGLWDNVGITFGVSLILLSIFVLLADAFLPPLLKWFNQRGQRTIVV